MQMNNDRMKHPFRQFFKVFLIILSLIITSELVLDIYWTISDSRAEDPIESGIHSDVYEGNEWVKDYYRELKAVNSITGYRWYPYVYWRAAKFDGKYINIDDSGIRHTWMAENRNGSQSLKIFVFGGSTAWGTGVPDESTIPSYIARLLYEDGINAKVINYGEIVYITNQEVITLLQELNKGNNPDIVVFYDGINDTYVPLQYGRVGIPYNESHREEEYALLNPDNRFHLYKTTIEKIYHSTGMYRFFDNLIQIIKKEDKFEKLNRDIPTDDELNTLKTELVRNYISNIKQVSSLSKSFGFTSLFYWQPVIFTKNHLTSYEQMSRDSMPLLVQKFFPLVYDTIQQTDFSELRNEFHNISMLLADKEKAFYIDPFHVSEEGNRIIAERIVKDIRKILNKERE